jgi:hypothetical protein
MWFEDGSIIVYINLDAARLNGEPLCHVNVEGEHLFVVSLKTLEVILLPKASQAMWSKVGSQVKQMLRDRQEMIVTAWEKSHALSRSHGK